MEPPVQAGLPFVKKGDELIFLKDDQKMGVRFSDGSMPGGYGKSPFSHCFTEKKGGRFIFLFFYFSIFCGRFGPLILPENKPCFFICAALILLA